MLCNCSRLETLLLRLSHVFLAQHYGLTPSATYCKSGEEPSAPGTRDRSAKARQPCCTAGKVVPPGQPLLLQGPFLSSSIPSYTSGTHPLQSTQERGSPSSEPVWHHLICQRTKQSKGLTQGQEFKVQLQKVKQAHYRREIY